jgi:hypothetical protein
MPDCEHTKTEFLMRRDGIDYMRCLACDQVFEADDLPQTSPDGSMSEDDPEELRLQHRHRKAS